ncbi:hypothetical protein [Streptomyces albidoflavus]|uniref:hypothetical protein n=1 Tax=Streptomyces albidoflavus TaxID=1886 RepID=UPI00352724A3
MRAAERMGVAPQRCAVVEDNLVVFDNDGVLVDSEPLSNTILAGYLTELGHPTSYEDPLRVYLGGAVHRIHDLVRVRAGRRLRRGRTVGPAHRQLLMVGAVGSGVDPRPEALVRSFARACVLGKREHLAGTCSDLGFCVGECVGGDTLNCGNVLGAPHRHPYSPSVLVQIRIVAGSERFPGSTARIRCVGVDTKVPRQRVQICQLSLNNC